MSDVSTANAPSVDIKDFLEESTSGLGLIFGTDLFIGIAPENPDQVVCLYDTLGFPQEKYGKENPGLQIYVRDNSYTVGHALIRDIKYLLHNKNGFIINGTNYILVQCVSDIGFLGIDERNRYQFSVNFQITRSGT